MTSLPASTSTHEHHQTVSELITFFTSEEPEDPPPYQFDRYQQSGIRHSKVITKTLKISEKQKILIDQMEEERRAKRVEMERKKREERLKMEEDSRNLAVNSPSKRDIVKRAAKRTKGRISTLFRESVHFEAVKSEKRSLKKRGNSLEWDCLHIGSTRFIGSASDSRLMKTDSKQHDFEANSLKNWEKSILEN